MLKDLFDKTLALTKFYLKKNRKYILIWLIALIGFVFAIASYYHRRVVSEAEWTMLAETLKNPSMVLLVGTMPDVTPTATILFALEMTLFTAVTVAIMNIFLVTRNTRQDEEDGRLEIVRSLSVGRLSPIAASLLQAFVVNLILALGLGLSIGLFAFDGNAFEGGLLTGFIFGAFGFMFACITAVFAQIFQSNRTVIISVFAFIGINFVFRGLTDISMPNLSWLSPLAWSYKTEVYSNNYWFPVILMFILSIIGLITALFLNHIRDLDGSFIKQKAGKTRATKSLLKPFGLVSRLNKTTSISWIIGILVLAMTLGTIPSELETFFESSAILQSMFPGATPDVFVEQFMVLSAGLLSIVIAIPVATYIGRVYSEEKKNYMENIVSKAITRNKLLASYLKYTIVMSIILLIIAIMGTYVVGYELLNFKDVLEINLRFAPAIIFIIGLGIFLIGLFPKFYGFIWLVLGYAFFVTWFGEMLGFPEWLKGLSPFYHIPVEEVKNLPLLILCALGIILTLIGFKAYNKRDITA